MRSDLVFGALSHVSNRYSSVNWRARQPASCTSRIHGCKDTTNEVLGRFQTTNPGAAAPVDTHSAEPQERRRAALNACSKGIVESGNGSKAAGWPG